MRVMRQASSLGPLHAGRFSGFIHAACLKLPCIPFAKLPEETVDAEGWTK